MTSFSSTWFMALRALLKYGVPTAPRGKPTKELLHQTTIVNMRCPVLRVPERKLSYQFMAAEAYWILSGDDRVDTIAPWNKRIVDFSDDGKTFFGAYGPRIDKQLNYVLNKLREDTDTRQACLVTWRPNPPTSKDVPCTVAITFSLRGPYLHCHVFMRSSDVWLGLPYDVFNFSMLAHLVCAHWNEMEAADSGTRVLQPGLLHLTAASSHLYQEQFVAAEEILQAYHDQVIVGSGPATPQLLFRDVGYLLERLRQLRDAKPGDLVRWWEVSDAPDA